MKFEQNKKKYIGWVATVIVPLMMLSCGVDPHETTRQYENNLEMPQDDYVVPPQEYYDSLAKDLLLNPSAHQAKKSILYIQHDGAKLNKGYGVGESFILCRRTATIPPSGYSLDQMKEIQDKVSQRFKDREISMQVVIDRPAQRPYTTIVLGGSRRDQGCPESRGILGIAPLDVGDRNKNDIGFVFNRYVKNTRSIVDAIAHEAGHSYGLYHVSSQQAIMYPAIQSNITGFARSRVERSTRTQDAPAILRQIHGKWDPLDDEQDDKQDDQHDKDKDQDKDDNQNDPAPKDDSDKDKGPKIPNPIPKDPINDKNNPGPNIPNIPNLPNGNIFEEILDRLQGIDIFKNFPIPDLGDWLNNKGPIFSQLGNLSDAMLPQHLDDSERFETFNAAVQRIDQSQHFSAEEKDMLKAAYYSVYTER